MNHSVGDLVRVIADNCDLGPGIVVEDLHETVPTHDKLGHSYRVFTADGKIRYYFAFELHPIFPCEIVGEWV